MEQREIEVDKNRKNEKMKKMSQPWHVLRSDRIISETPKALSDFDLPVNCFIFVFQIEQKSQVSTQGSSRQLFKDRSLEYQC